MKLRHLQIDSLPGISKPISLDFQDEAIYVISGPNASGKSSLLRALGYLLHSDSQDPELLVLSADFENKAGHWHVKRSGSQINWSLNGKPTTEPEGLPGRETLAHYLLRVETLLSLTGPDADIREQLQRELMGGFDLKAVNNFFAVSSRKDNNFGNTVQEKAKALQEAERENSRRIQEQQQLPKLEADIARAERALQQQEHYSSALELLKRRQKHSQLQQELLTWPLMPAEGLGNELDELEQQHKRLQTRRATEQQNWDEARQALQQVSLENAEQLDTTAPRKWLEALQQQGLALESTHANLVQAQARRFEAANALGLTDESFRTASHRPGINELAELEQVFNTAYEAQQRFTEEKLRQETVQQNNQVAKKQYDTLDIVAWLLLLTSGAALVFLGFDQLLGWTLIFTLIFLVGVLLSARRLFMVLLWSNQQSKQQTQQQQNTIRLQQAEAALAKAQQKVHSIAQQAGLNPDRLQISGVQVMIRRLAELDHTIHEESACAARHQTFETRVADYQKKLQGFLAQWQALPASENNHQDIASLTAALAALEKRQQQALAASEKMRQAERQLAVLQQDIEHLEKRTQQYYQKLELEPGDRHSVNQRLQQLPQWQALKDELHNQSTGIQILEKQLTSVDKKLLQWIADADEPAISAALKEAETASERLATLSQSRADILADINQAKQDLPLERYRAELDKARDELENKFEQRMMRETGCFMLEEVEQQHRSDHQTETLRSADERLRCFTHGQFSITLDNDGNLCARDMQQNAFRQLDELSTGTRMQLLIALRVAWIDHCELHTESLPLFLDEALTTTDAERFTAVAAALNDEAREKQRQIFYLTAQAEDLERWKLATGVRPQHIDMMTVQNDSSGFAVLDLPPRKKLPKPDDKTPQAWVREVGISTPDLLQTAGSIPLFWLLQDDLPLLYQLMDTYRLHTLGDLEGLLQTSLLQKTLDKKTVANLQQRLKLVQAWWNARSVGEGRPLNYAVLESAPAVTAKQLDKVVEIAESLEWDAKQLMNGLKRGDVKGFRKNKTEELEDWLLEQEYLDLRPPLSRDECYRQALAVIDQELLSVDEVQKVIDGLEVNI